MTCPFTDQATRFCRIRQISYSPASVPLVDEHSPKKEAFPLEVKVENAQCGISTQETGLLGFSLLVYT